MLPAPRLAGGVDAGAHRGAGRADGSGRRYRTASELADRLEAELKTCKESGCQYAENEAEYRKALRIAILNERQKGTPVTIIGDVCRGQEQIAEAKRRRDCSEAIYKASQEAINVIKLRIRMVDAQITRIWNSGDVTQGGYL